MRYFLELQYLGTHFHGWQRQKHSSSVQEEIERALEIYFKSRTEIVGCGRTDTGVHATKYFAHFEQEVSDKQDFLRKINRILNEDVAILDLHEVAADAHTRYDAFSRSYEYQICFQRSPFLNHIKYYYPYTKKPALDLLNQAAEIIASGEEFQAFSKVGSDVNSHTCGIKEAYWKADGNGFRFRITANRFLRGMVRLIVGACINAALEKISLEELKEAAHNQTPLPLIWSVPAEGLALVDIKFPYELS